MLVIRREYSIFANFLENLEHSWIASFDVILDTPVVRVDPGVAVGVKVHNKLELALVRVYKVSHSLRLFLTEGFFASVALTAGVIALIFNTFAIVFSVASSPVHCIVSIEVHSGILRLARSPYETLHGIRVLVFTFFQDFSSLGEVLLDESKPISVDHRHKVVDV
jgi:hypothetical protein